MNTMRTTDFKKSKPNVSTITTTLYDLIDGINSKILGALYTGKETIVDPKLTIAAYAVGQMFESGLIKFNNPEIIKELSF